MLVRKVLGKNLWIPFFIIVTSIHDSINLIRDDTTHREKVSRGNLYEINSTYLKGSVPMAFPFPTSSEPRRHRHSFFDLSVSSGRPSRRRGWNRADLIPRSRSPRWPMTYNDLREKFLMGIVDPGSKGTSYRTGIRDYDYCYTGNNANVPANSSGISESCCRQKCEALSNLFTNSRDDYKEKIPPNVTGRKRHNRRKKQALSRKNRPSRVKGFCRKPWQFLCKNGRCISQDHYCDGKDSCGDNSDETDCTWCNKTIQVTKMWQVLKSPEAREFRHGQSVYCYYLLKIPPGFHKPPKNSSVVGAPLTIQSRRSNEKRLNQVSSIPEDENDLSPGGEHGRSVRSEGKGTKPGGNMYVVSLSYIKFNFGLFHEPENCFDGYLRIIDGPNFARTALRSRSKTMPFATNLTKQGEDDSGHSITHNGTAHNGANAMRDGPSRRGDRRRSVGDKGSEDCKCDFDPVMHHETTGIGSYLCGQMGHSKNKDGSYAFYSQTTWIRVHFYVREFAGDKAYFHLRFRAIDMTTKYGYRLPLDQGNIVRPVPNDTSTTVPEDSGNGSLLVDILRSDIASGKLLKAGPSDTTKVYTVADSYCNRTFVDCEWPNCKIQSPGYPGLYLPSIVCGYTLIYTKPGNFQVKIIQHGDAFNVGSRLCDDPLICDALSGIHVGELNCPLGRLSFYDDDHPSFDKLIGTFCGDGVIPTIRSSGPKLYIEMTSTITSSALVMQRFYFISKWSETRSLIPSYGSNFKPGTLNCDYVVTSYGRVQESKAPGTIDARDLAPSPKLRVGGEDVGEDEWNAGRKSSVNQLWEEEQESFESSALDVDTDMKGKIVNLRHWFPPNTTCKIVLRGRPWERVWLHFRRFSYIPVKEPTMSTNNNGSEPTPDPCSDMISLVDSDVDNDSTKLVASFCGHWGPKICRPAVDERESRGDSRRFKRFLACPSDSAIFISNGSPFTVIFQGARGSYSQPDIRYDLRYEFVNTWKHGRSVPGTLCDEEFSSDKRRSGLVSSPSNLAFLYYKGRRGYPDRGSADIINQTMMTLPYPNPTAEKPRLFALKCKYTIRASKYGNEKLLINLYALKIHTSSHQNRKCNGCCSNKDGTCKRFLGQDNVGEGSDREETLAGINYFIIREKPDSADSNGGEGTNVACFCNTRYSPMFGGRGKSNTSAQMNNYTYVTKHTSTIVIEFNVVHLRWKRGNLYPETQGFELTYEYITFDCGKFKELHGHEGTIIFPPPIPVEKSSETAKVGRAEGPLRGVRCRWILTVEEDYWIFVTLKNFSLGQWCQGNFIRFWTPGTVGIKGGDHTGQKSNVLGAVNHGLTLKTFCQNDTLNRTFRSSYDMFYIFSMGFSQYTYFVNQSPVIVVDLMSIHPNTSMYLTFSQISFAKALRDRHSHGDGGRDPAKWVKPPGCTYDCPDNVSCITEQQVCTGVPSCPSPSWVERAPLADASGFYNDTYHFTYENPKFCAMKKRFKNSFRVILPSIAGCLIVIIVVIVTVIALVKKGTIVIKRVP